MREQILSKANRRWGGEEEEKEREGRGRRDEGGGGLRLCEPILIKMNRNRNLTWTVVTHCGVLLSCSINTHTHAGRFLFLWSPLGPLISWSISVKPCSNTSCIAWNRVRDYCSICQFGSGFKRTDWSCWSVSLSFLWDSTFLILVIQLFFNLKWAAVAQEV